MSAIKTEVFLYDGQYILNTREVDVETQSGEMFILCGGLRLRIIKIERTGCDTVKVVYSGSGKQKTGVLTRR